MTRRLGMLVAVLLWPALAWGQGAGGVGLIISAPGKTCVLDPRTTGFVAGQSWCLDSVTQTLNVWTGVTWKPAGALVGGTSVLSYGALCDGTTDDTTAVTNALAATPAGGILLFPVGVCKVTSLPAITKSITLLGQGQTPPCNFAFGNACYTVLANLVGSFLLCTSTSANCVTMQTQGGFRAIDLGIVGPGSGSTIGLVLGSNAASVINCRIENLGVYNFSTEVQGTNLQSCQVHGLALRGGHTGLSMPTALNSQSAADTFYGIDFQSLDTTAASVGTLLAGCTSVSFVGGLVALNLGKGFVFNDCETSGVSNVQFQDINGASSGDWDIDFEGTFNNVDNFVVFSNGTSNDGTHNGIVLNGCTGCNLTQNRWKAGRITVGATASQTQLIANNFQATTFTNSGTFTRIFRSYDTDREGVGLVVVTATSTTLASFGTVVDGEIVYCSDCMISNPCAGGGTGAIAKRIAGSWICN